VGPFVARASVSAAAQAAEQASAASAAHRPPRLAGRAARCLAHGLVDRVLRVAGALQPLDHAAQVVLLSVGHA